jgi:hypothetical protein
VITFLEGDFQMTDESIFGGINFPDPMDLRMAALYIDVSETRMRSLLREGRIPAQKDESNRWVVTKADLDGYNATKGQRKVSAGPTRRGTGKFWLIQVSYEHLQEVKDALAPMGIELQPRYDYNKQREYQAKRKAAKAAPKTAA